MNHDSRIYRQRQRRRFRVRKRTQGTAQRPRLSVFRSHKHICCQVIDDLTAVTIASASTRDKDLADQIKYGGNKEAAAVIGKVIAERATAAGVTQVTLDRGHYQYHGRIASLADAAREGGLKF